MVWWSEHRKRSGKRDAKVQVARGEKIISKEESEKIAQAELLKKGDFELPGERLN